MADRDPGKVSAQVDWREVARLVLTSREMDRIEEEELVPAKKVLYQFSARGRDVAQVLLGLHLKDGDGRVRLLPLAAAAAAARCPAGRRTGLGHGACRRLFRRARYRRGVQFSQPGGAHALAVCGGVSTRYTPAAGWAQAIAYKQKVLEEGPELDLAGAGRRRELRDRRILVCANYCHDATIATAHLHRGQWLRDLGSVRISDAGQGYRREPRELCRLTIFNGDGTDPVEAAKLIDEAVSHVRSKRTPVLLRLTVPRLEGHSFQDTQTYKSEAEVEAEWARDPLPKLKAHVAKLRSATNMGRP